MSCVAVRSGRKVRAAAGPVPPSCSPAELSEGEASVLAAIVGARWAWVARVYFAAASLDAEVASLAGRGLVECFDAPLSGAAFPAYAPEGPGVTLTPYGASLLRVELVPSLNDFGAETERSRWEGIKLDPDGKPLREKKGRGVKVPRSFGSMHLTEKDANEIVDGAPGPEYLVDEFNGEPVLCFQGDAAGHADATSGIMADGMRLLGGLGGKAAARGVPIVRDKRIRGKK